MRRQQQRQMREVREWKRQARKWKSNTKNNSDYLVYFFRKKKFQLFPRFHQICKLYVYLYICDTHTHTHTHTFIKKPKNFLFWISFDWNSSQITHPYKNKVSESLTWYSKQFCFLFFFPLWFWVLFCFFNGITITHR